MALLPQAQKIFGSNDGGVVLANNQDIKDVNGRVFEQFVGGFDGFNIKSDIKKLQSEGVAKRYTECHGSGQANSKNKLSFVAQFRVGRVPARRPRPRVVLLVDRLVQHRRRGAPEALHFSAAAEAVELDGMARRAVATASAGRSSRCGRRSTGKARSCRAASPRARTSASLLQKRGLQL
jgi:hypothetical protein